MHTVKKHFSEGDPTGGTSVPPVSFTPSVSSGRLFSNGRFLTGLGISGFSIMEIVLSLILLGISVLAVGQGYKAGRVFLRQSDNRSYAIAFANQKMEEYMAKTYADLDVDDFPLEEDFPPMPDKRVFHWVVDVKQQWEGDNPNTPAREGIPYKFITVRISYDDRNMAGAVERNEVQMVNIIPYPPIHTELAHITPANPMVCGLTNSNIITIPVRYETDKNLLVIYNITIKIEDANGFIGNDTIVTECSLDGTVKPVVTRTPILIQPLISNALGVRDVERDTDHIIRVNWHKQLDEIVPGVPRGDVGRIILREANIVILATEQKLVDLPTE